MSGVCLHGGSGCHLPSAGTHHGNPKQGGWGLVPYPFPQWPPVHPTAATSLARSSTFSRISSALPRSSGRALTSAASLTSIQSPSAAAPSSIPALRTSSVPKVPASITSAFPSSTHLSTAVVISTASKISSAISNAPVPTISPTSILRTTSSGPSTTAVSAPSISSSPLQSSDPALPSQLSSTFVMSVTGLSSIASSASIAAEAASQQTQAIGIGVAETASPGKMDMVVGIVIGIIVGVFFLILPFTLWMYRRRAKKQSHRRSIGAIEKDRMYRPWKKSEMNLRRKTANMTSLYANRPNGVTSPQPAFAPLRPNRSSSLYSGSILNGMEHLAPQRDNSKSPPTEKWGTEYDRQSVESVPLSSKRSSYRSSGYIYSDDPFEVPLIAPEIRRPESVMTQLEPPRGYKGRIKFGMGVQRTITRETAYLRDDRS